MDLPARFTEVHKMPTSRLGRFLAATRLRHGESLEQVAARLASTFTPSLLAMIEVGQYRVGAEDVPPLVEAYRLDLDNLFVGRATLDVDLDEGKIVSGDHVIPLPEDPTIDDVLTEYVRFVKAMRDLRPDDWLGLARLRAADVTELARVFDIRGDEVEEMLATILADGAVTVL